MAEKSLVKEVAEIEDAAAAVVVGADVPAAAAAVVPVDTDELDFFELLHATSPRAVTAATPTAAARFTERLIVMFPLSFRTVMDVGMARAERSAAGNPMETTVNKA
jgi:hypothetical protein